MKHNRRDYGFMLRGEAGHRADHWDVNKLIGLNPKQKLPVEGMPLRKVQGIWTYVEGLQQGPLRRTQWGRTLQRRFRLRVRALCPICNKDVALSRLPQHSVVHWQANVMWNQRTVK